jgi:EmrB/QacA subfamily drug resistance transporter
MTTAPIGADTTPLAALRSWTGFAVIAATVLSSSVGFLDAYVVSVAVPAIRSDLHASVSSLQFVVTGYLLTVAALLLLSGALADRFGRKRLVQIGLLGMLGSAILCSVAPNVGILIAARIIQGIGGALVVPSSLAMLNGALRVKDRARGIGIWAGLATLGSTVGPYAGGWLVDHGSWRWIFLLNVPLIVLGLVAIRFVPEIVKSAGKFSLDLPGALLAVVGLGGVIYALTIGPSSGWLSVPVVAIGVIGVGSLVALVPVERRRAAPMLRLSLFVSRQFDAINVSTVLFYGALAAANYLLVLQCELQLGYTASQAGAILIPESVVFLVLSPFTGALVARLGPRWLMVGGMVLVGVAFFWLSAAHHGDSYVGAVLPGVLLWGVGVGLLVTPLTAAVLAAVSDTDLGEASAINDAAARVGAVIVIALVPLLIGASGNRGLGAALMHGYQPGMIVMGSICVAAALVSGLFVSDERTAAPSIAPAPLVHGCALPVAEKTTSMEAR